MDLTTIIVRFMGNVTSYLTSANQVVMQTEKMASSVTASVTRMASQVTGQLSRMGVQATKTFGQISTAGITSFGKMGSSMINQIGGFSRRLMGGGGMGGGGGGGMGGNMLGMMIGPMMMGAPAGPAGMLLGAAVGATIAAFHVLGSVISTVWGYAKAGASELIHLTMTLGKTVVELGMDYEQAQTAFSVLVGSAEKGLDLFNQINMLAIRTPFTSKELMAEAQSLLGMGVNPNEMIATLSRLGDIAAGDTLRLHRLGIAYGQVLAAGHFRGEELRQFTNAGIGVSDFAKTAKMSTMEFRMAMERMEIPASVVIRTINELTSAGGRFYNLNEEQNKRVRGSWNALRESIDLVVGRLSMAAMQKLGIADTLQDAATAVRDLQKYGDGVIDWIVRAQTALDPFVTSFKALQSYATDTFKDLMGGADKWEDLGNVIETWARRAVTAFIFVTEMGKTLAKVPGQMMDSFDDLLNRIDRLSLGDFTIGDVRNALGKGRTALNTQFDPVLPKFWDESARAANMYFDQAQKIRNLHASFAKIPNQGLPFLAGGLGAGAFGTPSITVPMGLNPEAEKFAVDFAKKFKDGMTTIEKFTRHRELINQASLGAGRGVEMLAGGGVAALAPGLGPMLTTPQTNAALFEAWQHVIHDLSHFAKAEMPKAALEGSQEAADIIARSEDQRTNTEQQVVENLRMLVSLAAAHERLQQETVDAIREFAPQVMGGSP